MAFKLTKVDGTVNAHTSVSSSVTNGTTSSTVKVTASCYLDNNAWVYSTGVVARIYINGAHVATKTILGNENNYYASDGTKSVSASESITKTKSNQTISWYVEFWEYQDGTAIRKGETLNGSSTVSALDSYIVSYNANGGSGAPSSQTKWYGTTLGLSNTKPTRTGYTFKKWNTKSDGSGTNYNAGADYTANAAATLYAIWEEHVLTVNYYSNGADYCTIKGSSVSVSVSTNVKVYTDTYNYSDSSTNGLSNVQNKDYVYMTKTGYTPTGFWGTSSSGGTLIDQNTSFTTGQKLAEAFGKSLASGDASVNVYAQWDENYLTVNYYSNYATSAFDGAGNIVGADKNVIVHVGTYYYDNSYEQYGLANYSNSTGSVYMTRIGYTATGNWGTLNNGGTLAGENVGFATGQAVAEHFGKSLKTGNATINLYPQWKENILTVKYHSNYATSAFSGTENPVGADKDVIVRTYDYKYATVITNGIHNYSTEGDTTYLARTRYDATGYWSTVPEFEMERNSTDQIIRVGNDIAIHEDCTTFTTGAELADVLGLLSELEVGDVSIDLYAQWILLASRITVYDENGNPHRGLCHFYDSSGNLHYAILTVYGPDGKAHTVI